ncbi:ribonuclease H protein [Pyrus ussuriensis x Pyrus communis]|uniref:Ribonuclease H protein n=1 Tax=Pyrus ussuriensis x Pyrus communis TaxID=2448454 RepID=A0A5N5H6K0_9ROSA|nr:ribonuclease H protein [Pyrus ussuriensis x Pyrus communis]
MRALLACMERGYGIVQIETDLKVLVDMFNGLLLPDASIEVMLWDIGHLRQQLSSIEFLFIPRGVLTCWIALNRSGCLMLWLLM